MVNDERVENPDKGMQQQSLVYFLCIFLFIAFFVIDLSIPLGVAAGVLYVAIVLVSLWIPKKMFTLKVAGFSSVLILFGFFYSPMGGEMWKVVLNRGLALFAVWTTTVLTLQRKTIEDRRLKAEQEQKRIVAETKVLQGLLPICASCKKIRDDKGYWKQIETYIESHSNAVFSHGICQDCQEKLYGNQDWYKRKMKKI